MRPLLMEPTWLENTCFIKKGNNSDRETSQAPANAVQVIIDSVEEPHSPKPPSILLFFLKGCELRKLRSQAELPSNISCLNTLPSTHNSVRSLLIMGKH
jgi:hypothetical protein